MYTKTFKSYQKKLPKKVTKKSYQKKVKNNVV